MRILKHKKSVLLTLSACAIVAFAAFEWSGAGFLLPKKPIAEVKLSDFVPGTEVGYRIFSGSKVVAENKDVIQKDGVLSLPLNEAMIKDKAEEIVKYELNMRGPDADTAEAASAEMLRILLNLDKSTGDVSVAASGLDEFSGVVLEKENKAESLSADWAGKFSANVRNSQEEGAYGKDEAAVKLAFQNAGIDGDLSSLNPGEIEVFFGLFGDSSGSDLATVQARWSWALIRMTEELSAVMVMQTQIVGMFFDASIQLETQRKHQELMARAHKDYHPSEQMCRIGTFVRSVSNSETKSEIDKKFLNKLLIEEYTGVKDTVAAGGMQVYENAKQNGYINTYCDTKDSGRATESFCNIVTAASTGADVERLNKDIDYTRTLEKKLTLDVDFTDAATTNDEEDIIALAKHLYFPTTYDIGDIETLKLDPRGHFASRSYAAKMGVAHSSFVNLVGMKARAPAGIPTTATATAPPPAAFGQVPVTTVRPAPATLTEDAGWAYMKAMMREFGMTPLDMNGNGSTSDAVDLTIEEQIDEMLGERPSYYAQMEVLTKKIYQNPNFYTNLYDKPVNVQRIGASLDAIALMHQRDRFESLLRREMLTAVLVEEELQIDVEDVGSSMFEAMQEPQGQN